MFWAVEDEVVHDILNFLANEAAGDGGEGHAGDVVVNGENIWGAILNVNVRCAEELRG